MSPDAKAHFHEMYGKLADAVRASLESYLWVVGEVHKTFGAANRPAFFVPGMLLMEYAEPIDGVSILARTGSAKNCVPLVRSGFELQLNILYMLERDDKLDERSLGYEFFHFMKQLVTAQKCDPASVPGKQVRGQMKGEFLSDILDHPGSNVAAEIAALQKIVDSHRFAAAKAYFVANKPKHWYEMWGGPKGLEGLAHEIKFHARYEAMYRYWSTHAHGEAALRRVIDDKQQMDPVRCPKGLPASCRHACNLANEMSLFLVDRYVSGLRDDLRRRYLDRIKPDVDFINSVKGLEG